MRQMLYGPAVCVVTALLTVTGAGAEDLPGKGKSIRMARAIWDTGWFHAEVYRQAFQKLGYEVRAPATLDNRPFYEAVGRGGVDLWVNGWFPLHEAYEESFRDGAERLGYVAKNGALEGYLIDKKTAEEHKIKTLSDFKKPEIKKLFDSDGDGQAEMAACPPEWYCGTKIAEHLQQWGLQDHIAPTDAAYTASMADAFRKFKDGRSILFYTWTPNWTLGLLVPGKDVIWIETPEASKAQTVAGLEGCVNDPCKLGWDANDIRPVANTEFLKNNPAVKALLENMTIPLSDILAQNAKMSAGEDRPEDIEKHAAEWIKANQAKFDGWIKAAMDAAS